MVTNPKLRVMHVLGAKSSGGAELFYIRLVQALHKLKDVDVLCIVRKGSWAQNQLEEFSIPYKVAPFGGFFDFLTKRRLQKYIEEFQPHVIQGWMNRACKALPSTNIPTVGRLGGFYDLKNYAKCDYLVGNTKDIQKYIIKEGWPKNKAFYIPNFAPVPQENYHQHRLAVRQEYNIPMEAKVLLIAGRLHDVKGIDIAIMALRSLPEDVYLLVAGSGEKEDELKAMAGAEGVAHRVIFTGWVSRISIVASAADIWLVPSRHEPLGNVVLDAWAHGIPVIASKTHGPLSLIEDEVSGMLVPKNDPDGLLIAIQKVFKNSKLQKKLIEAGKNTLDSTFSEQVVVQQYINFYRKISKK